jgi:hypothetical protein
MASFLNWLVTVLAWLWAFGWRWILGIIVAIFLYFRAGDLAHYVHEHGGVGPSLKAAAKSVDNGIKELWNSKRSASSPIYPDAATINPAVYSERMEQARVRAYQDAIDYHANRIVAEKTLEANKELKDLAEGRAPGIRIDAHQFKVGYYLSSSSTTTEVPMTLHVVRLNEGGEERYPGVTARYFRIPATPGYSYDVYAELNDGTLSIVQHIKYEPGASPDPSMWKFNFVVTP